MASHAPITELRLFVYVTLAAAIVTLVATAVTWLAASVLAGFLTAALLGVPVALRGRMWGGFAASMAALLVVLGGSTVREHSRVAGGEEAIGAPELLPQRPEVTQVRLQGARIDLAAISKREHRHGAGKSSSHYEHAVAPVVPATWQPGQPIHLYAACRDTAYAGRGCMDAWQVPTETFVRARPDEEDCYRAALPETPWPSSTPITFVYHMAPEAYLDVLRREWFTLLRIPALAWLILGGLVVGANTLARRRQPALE